MQVAPSLDLAILGIPGILIGLVIGYVLGDIDTLSAIYRIFLGLFINIIVGILLALLFSLFLNPLHSLEMLFLIISSLGGFGLGLFFNWAPHIGTSPKNHIIYDPEEDDEEFDRQIEEALGGNK